ncbi:hypothetical protein [Dyadobacter frigoris]|uniref:YfhO family protein n=1 Tax=Dyadobacter frigoris TaxID=2576211 RepID=A0A4U6D696_9BACT|nr:hypothetical protein [Dyadobacter frigoris]TKT92900.1 hypothetical protein FDK13_08940 [Dyadobacter frigoris]GLU54323.1 hypothetical protein Dfri01_37840 [Dyadobacter frigoris]
MSKGALTLLVSLIIFIPIGVYFYVWDYYAINIPKWDDHALKAFIVEYAHAGTWQGKLKAIFKQHNEHRIALDRFFAWLDFSTFGKLNYRHLMLIGNLLLLGVIPLWYVLLKNNKKPLFALVPISFIWLTLAFWENMYWGMAAIQNFGVITLLLWTLYLCVHPKPFLFFLSLILALLTISTSGNGLLVFPVGAVMLFLSGDRKRLTVWCILSLAGILAYFWTYTKPESNPASKASLFQLAKGYMAFLGCFAESIPVKDHFGACVFMGIFLFLVAISIASATLFRISTKKYTVKFEKITDLFCLGTILFILGTAVIVVYSRAGFGLEFLITSRYKIYSVLLLMVAYLYVVIPIRGSFLSPYITAIVFLAITFNVFSYHYHLVDAFNLRKDLTTSQFNWTYTNKDLKAPADTSFAARIVEKTPIFYEKWLPLIAIADRQSYAGNSSALTELYAGTSFEKTSKSLLVKNTGFTSQRLQDSGIYILLSSDKRFYVFPTHRSRNNNRKELFLKQYYFAPGFHADIPFSALEKGNYKVAIIRQQGDETGILFKDDTISVNNVTQDKVKVNW